MPRHYMGITRTCITRFRRIGVSSRSCFCMAQANSLKRGRPPLTGEKASRQSSFVSRFPVYLIDQPRRGNAGRGTVSSSRDTVNRHGGDVAVVHLPEVGIRGNTHFPMSDMNNLQIADQMLKFLSEKKLD